MSPSGEVVNVDGFWTEIITTSDAARLVQLTSIIQMNASLVGPVGGEPQLLRVRFSSCLKFRKNRFNSANVQGSLRHQVEGFAGQQNLAKPLDRQTVSNPRSTAKPTSGSTSGMCIVTAVVGRCATFKSVPFVTTSFWRVPCSSPTRAICRLPSRNNAVP